MSDTFQRKQSGQLFLLLIPEAFRDKVSLFISQSVFRCRLIGDSSSCWGDSRVFNPSNGEKFNDSNQTILDCSLERL
ncbi:hypothetical protein CEXT_700271 [Caerostris extrusa]|uniref:Uncharacterized protein n=1 Tax=Caerostris extrusa TaxID=172846 RepID=A0AAV4UL27_CAEEX|nr:hypothetical protein CEXT_700271 [Caerostris extrusa]